MVDSRRVLTKLYKHTVFRREPQECLDVDRRPSCWAPRRRPSARRRHRRTRRRPTTRNASRSPSTCGARRGARSSARPLAPSRRCRATRWRHPAPPAWRTCSDARRACRPTRANKGEPDHSVPTIRGIGTVVGVSGFGLGRPRHRRDERHHDPPALDGPALPLARQRRRGGFRGTRDWRRLLRRRRQRACGISCARAGSPACWWSGAPARSDAPRRRACCNHIAR